MNIRLSKHHLNDCYASEMLVGHVKAKVGPEAD